jgi:hypothetical protein
MTYGPAPQSSGRVEGAEDLGQIGVVSTDLHTRQAWQACRDSENSFSGGESSSTKRGQRARRDSLSGLNNRDSFSS